MVILPNSKEVEQACLGNCLIDKEAMNKSFEDLKPDDFYITAHKVLFQNMTDLIRQSTAVDLITLSDHLKDKNLLHDTGGVTYLTQLMETVPVAGNIDYYIKIIKQKSNQRKIYLILEKLKGGEIEIGQALDEISKIPVIEVAEEDLKTLLKNTLLSASMGVAHKFSIPLLNKYLGGIDKGEIATIGAYTSQGKTSLSCQLAIDFAKTGEKRVLYCTSEMTTQEISRRILANQMPKNIMEFREGYFKEGERKAMDDLAEVIGDSWKLDIRKVSNVEDVKRYIRKYNSDIVFVDYLQNLERRGAKSDYERVTNNIKDLQSIALEKEISIFVVSQLSRDKTEIREPRINDLRDSGRIEECSNIVMLLYWKSRIKLENKTRSGGEEPEVIEVRIVKNRDGTIGKLSMDFEPEYARIRERARENLYDE